MHDTVAACVKRSCCRLQAELAQWHAAASHLFNYLLIIYFQLTLGASSCGHIKINISSQRIHQQTQMHYTAADNHDITWSGKARLFNLPRSIEHQLVSQFATAQRDEKWGAHSNLVPCFFSLSLSRRRRTARVFSLFRGTKVV